MKVPRKIKKKIPKGLYCYTFTGERGIDEKTGLPTMKIKRCPYYTWKNLNGVDVPYCKFLKEYGQTNPSRENHDYDLEHKKLLEYFGSEEKMDKIINGGAFDLLWDGCKQCEVNEGKRE